MTGLFEINLSASILILLIIVIKATLKNKLAKRFFSSIWAVVILRLIIPFSVPVQLSSVASDYTIPFVDKLNGTALSAGSFDYSGNFHYFYGLSHAEAARIKDNNVLLVIISLAVSIILMSVFTAIHISARKKYADALPLENQKILDFINSYNLRRNVAVKYSDKISAPLTYGMFKPVIVLPKACISDDFLHVECIMAHELSHIRFFDVLYKWIMMVITCLYWYNPFVWIMFLLSARDIEVACDIEAIEKCRCDKETYSRLLIGLEEKRSVHIYSGGFSAGAIKKRIKAIMKNKKSGIMGAAIAIILSVCSFTVFASAHTGVNSAMSMFTPTYFHTDEVSELLWLEPMRYYLVGGTTDEYIEVFEDKTIQVFGYDVLKEEAEMLEGLSDEELEYQLENLQEYQKIYDRRYKYELSILSHISGYDENGDTVLIIAYEDENTFRLNGTSKVYKAEKPWKAGYYQAYDEDRLLDFGFGYYYSEVDSSYIYVSYDVLEKFDENGKGSGPLQYRQIKPADNFDEVILALNFDNLRNENPCGYRVGNEANTLYDIETGTKYTLKSKPIFG